jgi:XTP/dITP diphosphohydrolase
MTLLIATTNAAKVREFRNMLATDRLQCLDLRDLPPIPPVEETGNTFRANACLKASAYARHFHHWALADDSGLEVDALGGRPGVHSARWAEMHQAGSGDQANNRLLLEQLHAIPDPRRTARFVCVLALSDPSGRIILTTRDTFEGQILHHPRGTNGFGYDPLFFVPQLGQTSAELLPEQKNRISHRGRALRALRDLMAQVPLDPAGRQAEAEKPANPLASASSPLPLPQRDGAAGD